MWMGGEVGRSWEEWREEKLTPAYILWKIFLIRTFLFVWVHMHVHLWAFVHTWRSQKTRFHSFLFLPRGSQGLNLGSQPSQQVPLPAEPSHQPQTNFFINNSWLTKLNKLLCACACMSVYLYSRQCRGLEVGSGNLPLSPYSLSTLCF